MKFYSSMNIGIKSKLEFETDTIQMERKLKIWLNLDLFYGVLALYKIAKVISFLPLLWYYILQSD